MSLGKKSIQYMREANQDMQDFTRGAWKLILYLICSGAGEIISIKMTSSGVIFAF